ncbi:GMP synthase - Glutamine amidotransferase [Terrimicrobium sacchariphilum]|uniref:GMP synthase-Glutamine amidotransferase n=1 Tax=Terrimicrobium sacchariphilum TaxID=690879 RepID=A0A146G1T5_TERSA|nr:gamma-glutamyl-gamma-aminobutyrate hydrolase family protein [Terrimicrobium sacchariphilum]GAT31829.1 GMP synthase - Glutamine amidotransferase [Terrimicrobium sacchariphilum]
MEFTCLQHVAFEGPARLENWLASKGIALRRILVSEQDLPDPSECHSVMVMGGPMNIYQHRDHPWLVQEKRFLRQCIDRGVPLLGICLGAQLLADALGARVFQNAQHEIGWFPVEPTDNIRQLFPSLSGTPRVLHWHGDTFELPRGAIRVASSEACPEQGFYLPGVCLGLQFHAESTPDSVQNLLTHCSNDLVEGPYVQSAAEIEAGLTTGEFAPWEPLFKDILKL